MLDPLWIDCGTLADVRSPEQLAALASGGNHVVLRFPELSKDEKAWLIGNLSAALPDYAVFDSGGNLRPAWVTIMPAIAKARVLERRTDLLFAVADYRHACATLVDQYQASTLPPEWQAFEHGDHCRFHNKRTGQLVEAPLPEWTNPDTIDPWFFAEFVKTTAGLGVLAELIDNNFHNAVRILEVVGENA